MQGHFTWVPSAEQIAATNVARLARSLACDTYEELHAVSVDEPDRFWRAVVDDLGIPLARTWDEVLDESRGIEWTTWFLGARINVADACVHRWARERPDREAAVWAPEEGERRSLTWAELSREVRRLAEALLELGIGEGDAVATFLPMAPEAAIASHACAHVGAIQVPIFSGFAGPAVSSRLVDAGARAVLTADASYRRGRLVPMKEVLDEALVDAPSVEHVVVWRRAGRCCTMAPGRDLWWDDVVEQRPGTLDPVEVDSETPYLLAYTSGTTGRPKGALHVQGGFLLSIAREAAYQADLRPGDRALFSTDMGWIMGPWTVVGGMACGATVVFMEGAPDWPHDRLWKLVESEQVTMLGVSPTLTRALIPHGEPDADVSSLRSVVTTGEPWNSGPYDWLDEHVCGKGRIPIVNCSGGTEVGACFLSVTMLRPTKPCSLGFPALCEVMDVFDDRGRPVRGSVGELVCKRPWPGMTRGLWRDPDRYLDTYWRRFPGARALRRHAQHRRQADRAGRARVGRGRTFRDRRSGRDRGAPRREGRGGVALLRARARRRGVAGRGRRRGVPRARQGVRARPRDLRLRAPEDAERQGGPARGARTGARRGSRRPLDAREPRGARRDRACRLTNDQRPIANDLERNPLSQ